MNHILRSQKIGFIGCGNMAQTMIKGILEGSWIRPNQIYATNRSPGKLQKAVENYKINPCGNNEELVEKSDIVILAVKPQDLIEVIEPIARAFHENQIVISVAAGITMDTLEKHLPQCRIVRLMPNTPSTIGKGVLGYVLNDEEQSLATVVEDLLHPLGYTIKVENEEQLESVLVTAASGTGFVFELMMYWQEWLEEHDFDPETARKITVETFLGTSLLAAQSKDVRIEELQSRVTSKKGTTAAGLQSMRELEIERALRISFEKAAMRNKEIARDFK